MRVDSKVDGRLLPLLVNAVQPLLAPPAAAKEKA
jgi:hypothetical protein